MLTAHRRAGPARLALHGPLRSRTHGVTTLAGLGVDRLHRRRVDGCRRRQVACQHQLGHGVTTGSLPPRPEELAIGPEHLRPRRRLSPRAREPRRALPRSCALCLLESCPPGKGSHEGRQVGGLDPHSPTLARHSGQSSHPRLASSSGSKGPSHSRQGTSPRGAPLSEPGPWSEATGPDEAWEGEASGMSLGRVTCRTFRVRRVATPRL